MTDLIRVGVFIFILTLASVCESLFAARPRVISRVHRISFHLLLSIGNSLIIRLCVITPFMIFFHHVSELNIGIRYVLNIGGIAEILLSVIVLDMFNYWWHRFNHRVPFLWNFHRYHHMDTEMDATTALRFHPVELILSYGAKCIWIIVWGPSVAAFLIFETLITAYAIFHHSNIRINDRLEKLLRLIHMTPVLHAAHHTLSKRTRDSNYSTIFIVWDYLFRSFKEATVEELQSLGIEEGRRNPLSIQTLIRSTFSRSV